MCIALCDIDRFKTINDEHGHDTGDRVLRYFGERLRGAVGAQAIVARYGGEEFVCLFERTPTTEAMVLLDAIRVDFEARPLTNRETGKPMNRLTFSAGLAAVNGDPRQALLEADRALYDAKRQGRNRVVAFGLPPAN
jgi:diguanylate cyclase